jgi:Tfp pilus assembly protein PilF
MLHRRLFRIWLALIVTLTVSAFSYGQTPLTGTRLKSAGNANPRTVLHFKEPDEVSYIRRLLSQGKKSEALATALGYVEQVETAGMDNRSRYYAHNALCAVYTYARESIKAEKECSRAIELEPGHWSAWNNRGTARYLEGDFDRARQDYERALEKAGNVEDVKELVRYNLTLLKFRSTE